VLRKPVGIQARHPPPFHFHPPPTNQPRLVSSNMSDWQTVAGVGLMRGAEPR
jgi:hypothetical protein